MIGTDANGCSSSTQITVTVNAEPTASVNASSSPICSGEDAVFTITGTPGAEVTYKLNAGVETNITLSSSGSYSLQITNATLEQELSLLKVTNTNTNCDVILNIDETVTVEPITPMPAVTNLGPYCQGDPSFSIASFVNNGTDLKWYLASSGGSALSSPPTQFTSSPDTFYYYVSQTINGCESPRAEIEVVVNATPVISISGNNSICPGDTTILTASGGVSYDWGIPGETNDTISVSPTTTTTYSVIGTDANGCSSSTQITVTVNAEPTANLSASSPICTGQDAVFTITGSANATVVYSIDSAANQTVVLDNSGSANITKPAALGDSEMSLISVNNANCTISLTDSETIFVNSNPANTLSQLATLDPYALDNNNTKINTFNINNGGSLFRLSNANMTMSYSLSSTSFESTDQDNTAARDQSIRSGGRADDLFGKSQDFSDQQSNDRNDTNEATETDLYNYKIPWSLRLAYTVNYNNTRRQNEISSHSLMFSGDIELSPRWSVGASSGYDLKDKGFTYTQLRFERDLESWRMNFSWIPFSNRSSWNFFIGIRSSILKDIKYEKRRQPDRRL